PEVLAPENVAGFAEKFDTAEGAAAKCIHWSGPSLHRARDGLSDVVDQFFGVDSCPLRHCDARKADARGPVTPLARPGWLPLRAQVRPVVPAVIVARIFKSDAFRRRAREVVSSARRRQRGKRVGKTGGTVRHAIQRPASRALPDPAAEAFRS